MKILLTVILLLAFSPSAQASEIQSLTGWKNVLEYGAVADAKTDCTATFQEALDSVAQTGGTIYAPPGKYLFRGSLKLPANVSLRGSWSHGAMFPGGVDPDTNRATIGKGTVFQVVGGRGEKDGTPFITLANNCELIGVVVHYPEQKWENDGPIPYPWAVRVHGDGIAVMDVHLGHAYQGVQVDLGPCHLIRNLTGTPLLTGLSIDKVGDIGRVENVHFKSPRFVDEMYAWSGKNARGFVLGQTDWEYMTNCFCWGYGIGFHFVRTESGIPNGNFLGIGADKAHIAVLVEECKLQGLSITNGEFVARHMGWVAGRKAKPRGIPEDIFVDKENSNPACVVIAGSNAGSVRFTNCSFWGGANNICRQDGTGPVVFGDCAFRNWGGDERDIPAFDVQGAVLQVHDSHFMSDAPQLNVGPKASGVIMRGNSYVGEWRSNAPENVNLSIEGNLRTPLSTLPADNESAIAGILRV